MIFSEKISTRVKARAPHCRVILIVYEMKRLGRDAAELTALADHLTAHGLVLEMLAGPLPGIYDPSGPGRILFAFCARAPAATTSIWTRPVAPRPPGPVSIWFSSCCARATR
ncbi:hypothetical protein AB0K40_10675 [Nonomuraea bangladeshensis]|uniref:Resolvase/invertase-type recombinase catalytic domain-containing protein n=1 Tax=Nonomuraea bangladeshensis TaxID=404385 RepID=A0ABV3H0B4_9ACTN